MNSLDPFEKRLARTPIRQAPGSLRHRILEVAAQNAAARLNTNSHGTAAVSLRTWFARCLCPGPVAWGTLGVAWAIVLLLNLSASSILDPGATRPHPARIPRAWTVALQEQRAMLQSLLHEPLPAAVLPAEPGPDAQLWRQGGDTVLIS